MLAYAISSGIADDISAAIGLKLVSLVSLYCHQTLKKKCFVIKKQNNKSK